MKHSLEEINILIWASAIENKTKVWQKHNEQKVKRIQDTMVPLSNDQSPYKYAVCWGWENSESRQVLLYIFLLATVPESGLILNCSLSQAP